MDCPSTYEIPQHTLHFSRGNESVAATPLALVRISSLGHGEDVPVSILGRMLEQ
jgi:hypothetical protein